MFSCGQNLYAQNYKCTLKKKEKTITAEDELLHML